MFLPLFPHILIVTLNNAPSSNCYSIAEWQKQEDKKFPDVRSPTPAIR